MQSDNVSQMHAEHGHWLEEVTYWHNELMFYDRLVLRLAGENLPQESLNQMEEFKSRFDDLQKRVTDMRTAIEAHEGELAAGSTNGEAKHAGMKANVDAFHKDFNKLKQELFVFADKEDY